MFQPQVKEISLRRRAFEFGKQMSEIIVAVIGGLCKFVQIDFLIEVRIHKVDGHIDFGRSFFVFHRKASRNVDENLFCKRVDAGFVIRQGFSQFLLNFTE